MSGTLEGPLALSQRKERATVGQYALNPSGYTRATKDGTIGSDAERRRRSPKPVRSSDRGLKLTPVKLDSVVIANQHFAVNMPLLLAHTARQTMRVGLK